MKALGFAVAAISMVFGSFASDDEHPQKVVEIENSPVFDQARPERANTFVESLDHFIGENGLFSSKYFNDINGKGCDFAYLLQKLEEKKEATSEVFKDITSILGEINASHTTNQITNIRFTHTDRNFYFIGPDFDEWLFLSQMEYKILDKEWRFLSD